MTVAIIVVVEDQPDNLKLLTTILTIKGHRVIGLSSGDTLAEVVRGEPKPDLVLLDIQLPGRDGYALIKELRTLPDRTYRVVALTAHALEEDRARALAAGGASIVLAGGPSDRAEIEAFRDALGGPVAADLTDLPVDALAAGLAEVDLLLACDSGPVHLAAAVGTPVVAIFGPTSPERWGPPPPGRAVALPIACAPCSNHGGARCPEGHHRCMLDLGTAAVVRAARDAMSLPLPE